MSGKLLVETLKELECPGADSLDAQGLDWTFENEALAPMLEWFCSNVSQSNILHKNELEEYKTLCQSGNVVLKGRQLEEALSNLQFVEDDSKSIDNLREEVGQLTGNLQQYKKQKDRMVKRRNLLNDHHSQLTTRLGKLVSVENTVKQQYKTSLAQAHQDDTKMDESMEKLVRSVSDMSALYDSRDQSGQEVWSCSPCPSSSPAMFLSQLPIQQYYTSEESYTTQLTAYTKKQFFQGIAEMAGSGEDSRYEILEMSDPDSLLVRGETEQINIRDCKELARLQKLYIKSESERLSALCDMKKMKGELQCAEIILDSLKSGTYCTDIPQNRERLQKQQLAVQAVRQDLHQLSECELPRLIHECKDAKVLRVLTGDYNLKLARQDYFTSNQNKVIQELIRQRARNEFVTMALEVELRRHRELHHILTSLYTQLHNHYTQYQARMMVMSDVGLTPARHTRETLDSRDKSTARLHDMLDESSTEGEKQLFLTYTSLLEKAEKLTQKHAGITTALTSSSNTGHDHLHILESELRSCEDLVYAGSTTTSGQPLLTPRPIQDTILKLRDMLHTLEQGIMNVVKETDHKKKLLKNDPLLARERKLFTYFFTNPAKLEQILYDLATRLQAEQQMEQSKNR